MQERTFPSVRDLYYLFEYDNLYTGEYARLNQRMSKELRERISESSEYNTVESHISSLSAESQAMGFEQGFACAAKLVMTLICEGAH